MHELAMENSGYKKELDNILEQIKDKSKDGCFKLDVKDLHRNVACMIDDLGYKVVVSFDGDGFISW